ncbi:MAG: hypothetical protein ABJH05_05625 [Fulvivirga sp.]
MTKRRQIFNIGIALVIALVFYLVKYPFANSDGKTKKVGITDREGLRQGLWKVYDENGELVSEKNYLNDTLHGVAKAYFDNGKLYTHVHYMNGHFVDTFYHYFKNGNLNHIGFYDSTGKSQGEFKVFYESGQLKQIGYKLDGQFHGQLTEFNIAGDTVRSDFYSKGIKESR